MDKKQFEDLISQLDSELNGDADHDIDVLNSWGEKYRGEPDSEPLMREISRRLFSFLEEEDSELPGQIITDMIDGVDAEYDEACDLIREQHYEEALKKLLPMVEKIRDFPLPQDTVWMDFASYIDALVFQDYFSEMINDREIGRHPLRPGRILYTLGNLLIEMERAEDAIEPLQMLTEFDPVCPLYLFELGEAYKRTGRIREAGNTALNAIACASNKAELARSYRDLAYCMAESNDFEDAAVFYLLSLRYETSRSAQAELAWIRKKAGVSPEKFTDEYISDRCAEMDITIGISEVVRDNLNLLNDVMRDGDDEDEIQEED